MSHGIIGFDAYEGLFTKAQWQQGKGRTPGSRVTVKKGGDSKEFIAIKLASGTWENGCLIAIDGVWTGGAAGVATTAGVTAGHGGVTNIGKRFGVLVFSSVSAQQVMAGTAFGYAQVFGLAGAHMTTASAAGLALGAGASAGQVGEQAVQATATNMIVGIVSTATVSVAGFGTVFLMYPRAIPGVLDD